PPDDARVPAAKVDFSWAPRPGTESIDVVYRHCLWHAGEAYDFNRCVELPKGGDSWVDSLARTSAAHFSLIVWIALAIVLLLWVLLTLKYRRKGFIIGLIIALVVVALLFVLSRLRLEGPYETSVADLMPGKVYFWKVVAETTDGVIVESPTQRLEVTP